MKVELTGSTQMTRAQPHARAFREERPQCAPMSKKMSSDLVMSFNLYESPFNTSLPINVSDRGRMHLIPCKFTVLNSVASIACGNTRSPCNATPSWFFQTSGYGSKGSSKSIFTLSVNFGGFAIISRAGATQSFEHRVSLHLPLLRCKNTLCVSVSCAHACIPDMSIGQSKYLPSTLLRPDPSTTTSWGNIGHSLGDAKR